MGSCRLRPVGRPLNPATRLQRESEPERLGVPLAFAFMATLGRLGLGWEELSALAPIVFSWLAGRGAGSSRLDPHDAPSLSELQSMIAALLRDEGLFVERIVVR